MIIDSPNSSNTNHTMDPLPQPNSMALVLYDPSIFQNRTMLPLPRGWTTASRTLTTFTKFPKLPAELRIVSQHPRRLLYQLFDVLRASLL